MNNVQLIIYPQFFNGRFNEISADTNEFVVDGINFNSFNASESYDTTGLVANSREEALVNLPPTYPNTWYRYRSTTGVTPALPVEALGSVRLYAGSSTTFTGVYQTLTNLTVGQNYTISIDIEVGSAGLVYINTYNVLGSSVFIRSQSIHVASASTLSTSFTASQPSQILMLTYVDSGSVNIAVDQISILPQGVKPSGADNILASGEVICDLYEDENIPLTLSVDNFKNAAEKIQSYSKAFKLPGTKKNNRIFDNIFEITRSAQGIVFNPYLKTQAKLKQDGFLLFEGYLRLIAIQDKKGEISYNVNLYSEVVALADVLKEKEFSDLDFSELLHNYHWDNIQASWTGALPLQNPLPVGTYAGTAGASSTGVLKYPFCNWNNSIVISNNIQPTLPNLESAFRPFISIKYCIDRIFESTPFTYTSNFFSSDVNFQNLYMDFNWGSETNPSLAEEAGWLRYTVPQDGTTTYATTSWSAYPLNPQTLEDEFGYDDTTHIFTVPAAQENSTYMMDYNCRVIAKKDANIEMRWVVNYGTATETVYNYSGVVALEGSAVANARFNWSTSYDTITSVVVRQGGYYTGAAPTVTIQSGLLPSTPTTFTATLTGTEVTSIAITGGDDAPYNLNGANTVYFNGINPVYTYEGTLNGVAGGVTLQPGDTLQLQWKASATDSIRQDDTINYFANDSYNVNTFRIPNTTNEVYCRISILAMTDDVLLQTLRGELSQWEFLKGLMTMFNLVSLPDKNNPNNILIEPYGDVFISDTAGLNLASRSISHDWTEKIDVQEIKLKPLTDLNKKTIFKFAEDEDDAAFSIYKNAVQGHLYGSKVYDASGFTVLQGEDEIVAEPFAATIVKPIIPDWGSLLIPTMYGMDDKGTPEGIDNLPRILFDCGVNTLSGYTYIVPNQNGVSGTNSQATWLQFSHLTQSNPTNAGTIDFHFGECQLIPPTGSPVPNNLFNTYWLPYYSQLYNPDTRIMSLKVDLRASDINTFDFADTVFIKNREFRVNKIDYKPNDLSIVEFILIP